MQLEADFEDSLREALLDDVERRVAGRQNNLVHQTVQRAHDILRSYGQEFDYNVEPIIDSFVIDEVVRTDGSVTVRWGWTHEAAVYLEFGTSEHTIDGDPVLSFVWAADEAPDWVAREFDQEGDGYRVFFPSVEVAGVKETRYVRDSLRWLRSQLGGL